MRIIISTLLLISTLSAFSQRVSFDDPDLTFSFKKPKKWEIFDDGYVVKVSPSAKDSANIFFTITYFEDPESFGLFPEANPVQKNSTTDFEEIKIDKQKAKRVESNLSGKYKKSYTFMKYGQRFVIETVSKTKKQEPTFRKIIRSIRITK